MKGALQIIFTIYTLTVSGIALAVRYEDDSRNEAHQRASDFTAVNEMLWVRKQSQRNDIAPKTLCQAMMKLRYTGGSTLEYIVYSAPPTAPMAVNAFVTTLTTSIAAALTGPRHHDNAVAYQTLRGGPVCPYKILYADPLHGCFILASYGLRSGRGKLTQPKKRYYEFLLFAFVLCN
uniref:Putative secreted protein n=1 Tax=Amblyomma triste TaxID=251400 RepID=A0A023G564_AMBTT